MSSWYKEVLEQVRANLLPFDDKHLDVQGPNSDIFLADKEDVDHIVHNFVFCPPFLSSLLLSMAKDKPGAHAIDHILSIVTTSAKKHYFPFTATQSTPLENAYCFKAYLEFAKPILTFLEAAQTRVITAYNFDLYEDPDGGELLRRSGSHHIGH